MKIQAKYQDILKFKCDVLVLSIFEDDKTLPSSYSKIDKILGGNISKNIKKSNIKACLGSTYVIDALGKMPCEKILILGFGQKKKFDLDKMRQGIGIASKTLKNLEVKNIGIDVLGSEIVKNYIEDYARAVTEGILLSLYTFTQFKKKDKQKPSGISQVSILCARQSQTSKIQKGIRKGSIFSEAANFTRDLVNQPANYLTTTMLSKEAAKMARKHKLKCTVFSKKQLEKMKMMQILGVGQGSDHPPNMIVIEYKGAPGEKEKTAIVGKAITFDSGGISIKPASGMEEMKTDMSGGGAVLGVMKGLALLKPKVNVVGIVPAAENMPGGGAIRPGDILQGASGKTVEVISTDAEGRMILADAVYYAEKTGCGTIVDIATLTGACRIALGPLASAIFSRDPKLLSAIIKASEEVGEKLWHMPLYEEYQKMLKSDVADIKNVGERSGGAITAAMFIEHFIDKAKWVHIDIAGPAYTFKDLPYTPKGGTGVTVRTLLQWLTEQS